jgi:hypothetical protein
MPHCRARIYESLSPALVLGATEAEDFVPKDTSYQRDVSRTPAMRRGSLDLPIEVIFW